MELADWVRELCFEELKDSTKANNSCVLDNVARTYARHDAIGM
jgi:hypothetical protein